MEKWKVNKQGSWHGFFVIMGVLAFLAGIAIIIIKCCEKFCRYDGCCCGEEFAEDDFEDDEEDEDDDEEDGDDSDFVEDDIKGQN